jgi:hypothetical protein
MKKSPDAYILATHIHESFHGQNDILTLEEIATSGVRFRKGSSSSRTSQRLEITGQLNDVPTHQTLALTALGRYHLSTVDQRYGGGHTQVVIMPESTGEGFTELANSLFMHKLVEIAMVRED